jgi:hypothetical protein
MTTLTTMRASVCRDLKGEDSANYRWSDNEIDRAIERAVLDYSLYCPLEQKSTIATVDLSADVSLSTLTDLVDVVTVEHPVDQLPAQYRPFRTWAGTLSFLNGYTGDGGNCYIRWLKKHSIGASTSSVPPHHEAIVALGATAFAISSQAQYQVNTANTGGGNVDNDYGRWAREKFTQFYAALSRIATCSNRKLKNIRIVTEETL